MKTKRVEKITSLFIAIMMLLSTFISVNASVISSSQGSGKSKVVAEIAPAMFSATVPYVLPISVDADNNVSVADNAKIVNNSNGPINVIGADISTNNGWEIVDSSTNFKSVPVNTKQLKLEVMNESLNPTGSVDASLFDTINGESSINLIYNAETAVQSEAIESENVANALFTVAWDELFISKATVSKSALNTFAKSAVSFQKTQENLNIDDVKADSRMTKIDDGTTNYSIYAWTDSDNNGYWWTDAITVYLPEDSSELFSGCTKLITLDLTGFDTSNVSNMSHMFSDSDGNYNNTCTRLKTLDISNFDTSKVTDMGGMFEDCYNLTSLNVSNFNTEKVTNMCRMFSSCKNLTLLDVSSFDTSNVSNMSYMFCDCPSLTSLNVSNFVTNNVTNMGGMFNYCLNLTSLNVLNFDTSKVTNVKSMFQNCSKLTSLDVSIFDTSNVTDMNGMFWGCSGLTSLNVSNFDTSKVKDMNSMFRDCNNLTSLNLSTFDTSNTTSMGYMFSGCSNITSLDISHFNTSNVTKMYNMFNFCLKVTSLDVSSFDTSKVTDMDDMFRYCKSLTSLKLSNFNTSNLTRTGSMFYNCSKLRTIYVSNFSTDKIVYSPEMFDNCTSIVGGNGTRYNSSYTDKTYARIDRSGTPGYFTYKAA